MEIEAKFLIPDQATLEWIAGMGELAGFVLSPPVEQILRDTYLDTGGHRLLAAGYACRRRESDGKRIITVKGIKDSDSAIHRREEIEAMVGAEGDGGTESLQPGPLRDLVHRLSGGEPLLPLLELGQRRLVRVLRKGATPVAELCLDRVDIESDEPAAGWLELEIELLPTGDEADLETIVMWIRSRWNLLASRRSKFERALEAMERNLEFRLEPRERELCTLLAPSPDSVGRRAKILLDADAGLSIGAISTHVGLSRRRVKFWLDEFSLRRLGLFPPERLTLDPPDAADEAQGAGLSSDDTMTEASRKILSWLLQKMVSREAGVFEGSNHEDLHRMRVAARKARSALRYLSGFLGRASTRPFRKSLRKTGERLGAVRDLDVFTERLQGYRETLPPGGRSDLDLLHRVFEEEYAERRVSLLSWLDDKDYLRFRDGFREYLDDREKPEPGLDEDAPPRPRLVRHVLPGLIFASFAGIKAYDDCFSDGEAPLYRYHQLRKDLKCFRYCLEFFGEVLGAQARPLIEKTRRLQDLLGRMQDAEVACGILRGYLAEGKWSSKPREHGSAQMIVAPQVAAYLATRQEEIRNSLVEFPPLWNEVSGSDFSTRLAVMLAGL